MKTFLVLLSVLYASSAIAAEWFEYFHSAADTRSYIDKSSIVLMPDGKVRAWKMFRSQNGNGNRALTEVDCKQRMYTIRAMEPLDPNDVKGLKAFGIVMRGWTEPDQFWDYITTADSQEAMYNAWCKGK